MTATYRRITPLVVVALLATLFAALVGIPRADAYIPATSTPQPSVLIPPPALSVPIEVVATGEIADVDVAVRIDHTYVEDLRFEIVHPSGAWVGLANGIGSSDNDFGTGTDCSTSPTVFDDEAATSISEGAAPFAASFRPLEALAALDGSTANGTWSLQLIDLFSGDFGTFECVELRIALTDGSVITQLVTAATAIPDFVPSRFSTHAITVADAGVIADLDVVVRLDFEHLDALSLSLRSPTGTSIDLISHVDGRNLGSGPGCSGTPTVFDDEASTSITASSTPAAATFRPEGLLSAVDGQVAAGVWELVATQDYDDSIGGRILCVELRFTLVNGAVITVTTTDDVLDATDGLISLREAFDMAAADGSPTTIELAENATYLLTRCGSAGANEKGALVLKDSSTLTIRGNGSLIEGRCALQPVIRAVTGYPTLNLERVSIVGGDNFYESEGGGVTAAIVNLDRVSIASNYSVGAGAVFAERITAINSTIINNEGDEVGGLHGMGRVTLVHSTLARNEGYLIADQLVTNLIESTNSVVGPAVTDVPACSVRYTPTSHGYNFVGDDSCRLSGGTDIVNVSDPGLEPIPAVPDLFRPTLGSPLFNAIPAASCTAVTVDQLGTPRPRGARCEIGAVERLAPIAVDDTASTAFQTAVTVAVFANDSDPWGSHQLAASSASTPAHGTVEKVGDAYRYTPASGFAGTDTFTYTICEAVASCDEGLVTITVGAAQPPPPPTLPTGASQYFPLSPQRLFDTRDGAPVSAGASIDVQVAGYAGVPAGATAVVMNVTITEAGGPGFVTVWPTGAAMPNASSINTVSVGQTVPNLVTVPLGDRGRVSLYTESGGHLLADVAGYYAPATGAVANGRLVALTPTRLFDTRTDSTLNKLGADSALTVAVAGQAGVPATGAAAVIMNVTATDATAAGYVTVWPGGQHRPNASNLNLTHAGHTAPNLVIVPLGADGTVSFYSETGTHLIADITGYLTDSNAALSTTGLMVPLAPSRVFDTRDHTPLAAGEGLDVPTGNHVGVPSNARSVVLNVTATGAAGPGHITAWPTGIDIPLASTLNINHPGETRANAAILPLGTNRAISYYTNTNTHLLTDIFGYFL